MSIDRGVMACLAVAVAAGCAGGAGPFQPGRNAYATAGAAAGDTHDQARARTLPEVHGGETPMYALDGAFYAGMKQGASWSRGTDGAWSDAFFFMEIHAGLAQTVGGDRLTLAASAFVAGYGTGEHQSAGVSYVLGGGELVGKVALSERAALRAGGGPVYGWLERDGQTTMESGKVSAWGLRAVGGVDYVLMHLGAADVVLVVEAQALKSQDRDLGGVTGSFEGGALAFELVFAGF